MCCCGPSGSFLCSVKAIFRLHNSAEWARDTIFCSRSLAFDFTMRIYIFEQAHFPLITSWVPLMVQKCACDSWYVCRCLSPTHSPARMTFQRKAICRYWRSPISAASYASQLRFCKEVLAEEWNLHAEVKWKQIPCTARKKWDIQISAFECRVFHSRCLQLIRESAISL